MTDRPRDNKDLFLIQPRVEEIEYTDGTKETRIVGYTEQEWQQAIDDGWIKPFKREEQKDD